MHQGGSTQYKLENKKIKLILGVKLVCACKKGKATNKLLLHGSWVTRVRGEVDILKNREQITV